MAYYWAMGTTGTLQSANTRDFDQRKEAIKIEHIWLQEDGTTKVVVRNVGVIDAGIGAVYVDGVLGYSASSSQGVVIKVGDSVSFLLSGVSPGWHLFKVATLRGNIVSQRWGPPGAVTAATQTIAVTGTTTGTVTTWTTSTSTTVTTITFTTTYTTLLTTTTIYSTTSGFTTTYTTTRVTTTTYICECTTQTITTTKTSIVRSTGTTTISTTRTTTITTTVTTIITTTSNVP